MPYQLTNVADDYALEPEFDRLDWQFRNGEFDTVEGGCRALVDDPAAGPRRASWAYLLLGEVQLSRNRYSDAMSYLEQAVDLAIPLRNRLAAARCKVLLNTERSDDAWALAQHLVTEAGDSWRSWEALATCQRARGDVEGAWRSLVRATQLNPAAGPVILAMIQLGSTPERARDLAPALQAHLDVLPVAIALRVNLFTCYVHLGEIDKAIDQAQRITSFAPVSVIDAEVVAGVKDALDQLIRLRSDTNG